MRRNANVATTRPAQQSTCLSRLWRNWRPLTFGLVMLALLVTATLSAWRVSNAAANHANQARHGVIPLAKVQPKVTRSGEVDISTLPRLTPAQARALASSQHTITPRDRLTPTQRAAYQQAVMQGKIALPQAQGQLLPAPQAPSANFLPGPYFSGCGATGYTGLPCVQSQTQGVLGEPYSGGNTYDHAIASNPSYVLIADPSQIVVYTFDATENGDKIAYGPVAATNFYSSVLRSGDVLSEPQAAWDATRNRWVMMEDEFTLNSDGSVAHGYYDVAVSRTQNVNLAPTQWYVYQFATDVDVAGMPNWCDYPTLGSDYWGLWISCTAFSRGAMGTFTGNALFALNKNDFYSGISGFLVAYTQIPNSIPCGPNCVTSAFRFSPAIEDGTPEVEFLLATDEGYGRTSSGYVLVSFYDTHKLTQQGKPASLFITNSLPVSYADPINASQPGAPTSLQTGLGLKQIEYKAGHLAFAFTTATQVNGVNEDGAYWADIIPTYESSQLSLVKQDSIWAFNGADAYSPTLEMSAQLDDVLFFDYSSSTVSTSIGYTARRATDSPNMLGVSTPGSATLFSGTQNTTGAWPEYGGCSLDTNLTVRGTIWCVGAYGDSSNYKSWDAYIVRLRTE